MANIMVVCGDSGDNSQGAKEDQLLMDVVDQLEHYLGDINIVHDKFLLKEMKKDDGWIKLSLFLSFSRMKRLTQSQDLVVKALAKFGTQDCIEVSPCKSKIRRYRPLPSNMAQKKQDLINLKINITGFSMCTQFEDLLEFCRRHGEVESCSMQRHNRGPCKDLFNGTITVLFKYPCTAESVIKLSNEGQLRFKPTEPLKAYRFCHTY